MALTFRLPTSPSPSTLPDTLPAAASSLPATPTSRLLFPGKPVITRTNRSVRRLLVTCRSFHAGLWSWLTSSNSIGQSLSLAASFLFPSVEGPSYTKGSIVNIAFQAFGLLIALSMTLYYRFENKRRDEAEGGRPPAGTHLDTHEFYDKAQGELPFVLQ